MEIKYRVTGKIFVTDFCRCPHCVGHGRKTVVVERVVDVDYGSLAVELVEDYLNGMHSLWEWYPDDPKIEEILEVVNDVTG